MKYLKIQNNGELDIRLVSLMGGTTKAENPNKIGQFGTGLKYAVSYLVRTENKFKMFIGEEEVIFETRDEIISEHEFKEIYCNGKSMNITTRYGYQWKGWEALREIWCNAKDEGSEQKKETTDNSVIKGVKGRTTFFIELTDDITEVITDWDKYFLLDKPIFENSVVAIYLNTDENQKLKIYKNRVLIHTDSPYKSLFVYDLKEATLNELRQYTGYAPSEIGRALLQSSKEVVEIWLNSFSEGKQLLENKIDFQYFSYNKTQVKNIFQGFVFLHPDSTRTGTKRSISVNKSLFYLLQDCELPTEKVYKRSGRYYGGSGSGYSENEEVLYEEVENDVLELRIQKILNNYNSNIKFSVVVPIDSDFEIMMDEYNDPVFSSDLVHQSQSDLEATVLVAIFNTKEGNIFKALKRLIKFAKSNKAFDKIFFGSLSKA